MAKVLWKCLNFARTHFRVLRGKKGLRSWVHPPPKHTWASWSAISVTSITLWHWWNLRWNHAILMVGNFIIQSMDQNISVWFFKNHQKSKPTWRASIQSCCFCLSLEFSMLASCSNSCYTRIQDTNWEKRRKQEIIPQVNLVAEILEITYRPCHETVVMRLQRRWKIKKLTRQEILSEMSHVNLG